MSNAARLAFAALLALGIFVLALPAAALGGDWKFQPTINAPWAQGGDAEGLDVADNASGLCRSSQFTGASPYAATSNVDVITGDPVNQSGVSNFGCTTPQNETTVAVNPTNPMNLVAGSNDYRVCCDFTGLNDGTGFAYASMNGGTTWTNVQLPGLTAETGGHGLFAKVDSAGDPAVAFAPDGTVYYANIVFSRVSFASGVAVSTSHDGGLTWSQPSMITWANAGNHFNDKEWIAAGPNGAVVVTWTDFDLGPHGAAFRQSPIVMALSRDGGRTWVRQGSPVADAFHPFNQGSQPMFDKNGMLYVVYEGADPSTGFSTDQMVIARSTDLGLTFTQTQIGRVFDDNDCYPIYAGRQTLTGEHFRMNSYPSLTVDPASGALAVAWADDEGAGSCGTGHATFSGTTNAKLKLVTSANGTSWSSVRTLGAGDVVFPSVAMSNGKAVVSYYTRAFATSGNPTLCDVQTAGSDPVFEGVASANICLDYAARVSTDNFAAEHRLTTESANPAIEFAQGTFIGDYSQVALGSNGVAHPVWTDFRGRPGVTGANQDVYTTTITP